MGYTVSGEAKRKIDRFLKKIGERFLKKARKS
jgi:hypothetical protein